MPFHGGNAMTVPRINLPYQPHRHQQAVHAALAQHRFVVAACHRRFGKTVCAVNHLIYEGLKNPGQKYGYATPYRNQAKSVAWNLFKEYLAPVPGVAWNESDLVVTLPTGSTIRLMGVDNDTGIRGLGFSGLVCDEVADMPSDSWQLVLRPTLSRTNGWCLFISTPRGVGNLFHDLWVQSHKEAGWKALAYRADQTGQIPAAELESMRREMSDSRYRQEMLVDFSAADDDVLIDIDMVTAAAARYHHPMAIGHAAVVLGVDLARHGADRSVIIKRQGLQAFPPMVFQNLDLMAMVGRIVGAINQHRPDAVFVDETGLGAGVVDRLRELGHQVIGVNFGSKADDPRFVNKRTEIYVRCRDWLKQGGALPPDLDLQADLCLARYGFDAAGRVTLEKKEKIKERAGRSPDLSDALALTFTYPVAPKPRFGEARLRSNTQGRCLMEYNPFEGDAA